MSLATKCYFFRIRIYMGKIEAINFNTPLPILNFADSFAKETLAYRKVNTTVKNRLQDELRRRGYSDTEMNLDNPDWDFFERKLLRYRGRLVGGIAAYAALTNG